MAKVDKDVKNYTYAEIYPLIVDMERAIIKALDRAKGNDRALEEILEILSDYVEDLKF